MGHVFSVVGSFMLLLCYRENPEIESNKGQKPCRHGLKIINYQLIAKGFCVVIQGCVLYEALANDFLRRLFTRGLRKLLLRLSR